MTAPRLTVRDLHAGYEGVEVVRGLTFDVHEGQVVALLGPNGAGKSTTLTTIAGLLKPLSGEVIALGQPISGLAAHRVARAGVSLVPEDRGLFGQLRVTDNLRLACGRRVKSAEPVIAQFTAIHKLWNRRVSLLSGGEQQMVALACALVRRPKLLLLDEMSLGLAPQVVTRLLATVRQLADEEGLAVLLVEQHVQVALSVCDHAMVLRHGELVINGTATAVRQQITALEDSYLGSSSTQEPIGIRTDAQLNKERNR